jgi:hypothetical protein
LENHSLCPQGYYQIDVGGTAGRQIACKESAKCQQEGDREGNEGVEATKFIREE